MQENDFPHTRKPTEIAKQKQNAMFCRVQRQNKAVTAPQTSVILNFNPFSLHLNETLIKISVTVAKPLHGLEFPKMQTNYLEPYIERIAA